jgi:hypothetical protein
MVQRPSVNRTATDRALSPLKNARASFPFCPTGLGHHLICDPGYDQRLKEFHN